VYCLWIVLNTNSTGAKWVGIKNQNKIISGCFIFPNFKNIWEIAGVFTLPDYRRKGYAEAIVLKSLRIILNAGYIPRYQVVNTNTGSIKLAEKIGMKVLLTVNHFELNK
jgi:predicted GNAT family acetyltransferase